jgi:hypothetical protein
MALQTSFRYLNGSVSPLDEGDPCMIPGSGRDAFAGVNMPLAPSGVSVWFTLPCATKYCFKARQTLRLR